MRINKPSRFKRLLVNAGLVSSAGAKSRATGRFLVETTRICNAQSDIPRWGAGDTWVRSRLCRGLCKSWKFASAPRASATFRTLWSSHRVSTVRLSTRYTFARAEEARIWRCVCAETRSIRPPAGWTCCFRPSVMSVVVPAGLVGSVSRMIRVQGGARSSAQDHWDNQGSRSRKSHSANNSIRDHWQWGWA